MNTPLSFLNATTGLLTAVLIGLGAALFPPGEAGAASGTILLVSDDDYATGHAELGGDAEADMEAFLTGLGYTVIRSEGNGSTAQFRSSNGGAAAAAALMPDLILVSRATSSGSYNTPADWNGINKPLLLLSPYLARSTLWRWLESTSIDQGAVTGFGSFVLPEHPIVSALGTSLFDISTSLSRLSITSGGNGTVIATLADGDVALVEWPAGTEFYPGAGQTAGARRVFMGGLRYHEADGARSLDFEDYSGNGMALLANVIEYTMTGAVTGGAPAIGDLVPADGTSGYNPAAGLSFRVSSEEMVGTADVRLILNGSDVSGGLVFGGSPTDLTVSYPGLVAGTVYAATVTASNALGVGTAMFGFDTVNPDLVPPVVQTVVPAKGSTIGSLSQITVIFSEPVVNVSASDFFVGPNTALAVSGSGTTYTFQVLQPSFGTVDVSFDPGAGIEDLGNPANAFDPGAPGAAWQYDLADTGVPMVLEVNPLPGRTIQSLTQIEVTFDEAVSGVDAGDLLIDGAPATAVSGAGAGPYVFEVGGMAAGMISVAWAAGHGIVDMAASPNGFAGGMWSYTVDPDLMLAEVRINEFLAGSLDPAGLTDEFGNLEDWIELHNFGAAPVDLTGYSLTDETDSPGKWVFPPVILPAGGYLVVFASGLDRKAVGGTNRLHCNFKLNAGGNPLALFNSESPRQVLSEFSPEYPEQRNDHSYGLDGAEVLRYFSVPTPGAANGSSTIEGLVPGVHFSVGRGCYDGPFTLHLDVALAGAQIRYTTDGSEPTASSGQVYSGPLVVQLTTVLRAGAFKAGFLPSRVSTHTYLFLEQVIRQSNTQPGYPATFGAGEQADYEMDPEIVNDPLYAPLMVGALKSLPVLSVVMNRDDMFHSSTGIYLNSTQRDTVAGAWERACSLELILTNGQPGFQVDCGIQIQGNANRTPNNQPKHAFRVVFKGEYGPGRLSYRLFPDSQVDEFNTLVLRSDYNNSWLHWDEAQRFAGQRIRDAYIKSRMVAMGGLAGHNRYVHLYINGLYWGIYDPTERPDGDFAASYLGGDPGDYDIYNEGENKSEGPPGVSTSAAYTTMVGITGLSSLGQYDLMKQYLDTTQFIDYMIVHFYCANQDWGEIKNWYAIRRRLPGEGYKYVPWDGERTLEGAAVNLVNAANPGPSGLQVKLQASAEYNLEFADRVHKHFFNGGALTPASAAAGWMGRAEEMFPAIVAESARWGDYRRDVDPRNGPAALFDYYGEFLTEQNRLLTAYFPNRTATVLTQFRNEGLYPSINAPAFNQHGGAVARGFSLTMSGGTGTTYYTTDGSDPRVYGTGAISAAAQVYSGAVILNSSAVVKARARSGSTWSALNEAEFNVDSLRAPLRITEIMYNPVGGDIYEYVEIQNIGSAAVNAGNFYLTGITYLFPANTILLPGQVIVLGSDNSPAAFAARYPGVSLFGRFSGNLSNGGEKISIKNGPGLTLVSVDYLDGGGWPAEADGQGPSLEIIDPDGDPDAGANWRASSMADGTPGVLSVPPVMGPVVIHELMADNASALANEGLFPDWIEFHNTGGTPVDLGDWSVTDDGSERKYVFPGGTVLEGGEFLVVWCDTNGAAPGLHTGFALDRNGETVSLYDASTNRVDAVSYGLQVTDLSVGRVGGQWVLNEPTPGAANVAATVADVSGLKINEWLTDPFPGGEDWVELYNSGGSPVSLQGVYVTTGSAVFQIESLSYVAAGGFAQLFAESEAGPDELDLTFPASGGSISIHDPAGSEIDSIGYGTQTEGVSEGRLPDGAALIAGFPGSVSPLAANYQLSHDGPVLNEIMARNGGSVTDGLGRTNDWVELYNPGAGSFDLSGFGLSERVGEPLQWTFPPGTTIGGGGYLLVWFDAGRPASVGQEADLNQGSALGGNSDGVYLSSAAGQILDRIEYGFQIVDRTIGLAGGEVRLLEMATPLAANSVAATLGQVGGLKINEWLADPAPGDDDWFELVNLDSDPVDLAGVFLTDDLTLPGRVNTQVPALSFIAPFGYVQVLADGSVNQGGNHVDFSLDGRGEAIGLYRADLTLIDAVFFGVQAEGVSQGRLPDGGSDIIPLPEPSPAAPNSVLSGPPVIIAQPVDVLGVSEGEDVEFEIRVVGQGTLTIQWFYNGNPIMGANGTRLSLPSVVVEQQGQYFAIVATEHGVATSDMALLSVEAPPSFLVQPVPISVVQGGTAVFTVLTRGTLPMGYRWRRGGATIAFGDYFDNVNTLVITNVQTLDGGLYQCIITNSVFYTPGVGSSFARLTVLADGDGDLIPDEYENLHDLNPNDPADAVEDRDGDGSSNRDEYEAGTDLDDPLSFLRIAGVTRGPGALLMDFIAISNKGYTVQSREPAGSGEWTAVMDVFAAPVTRSVTVTNAIPVGVGLRYYRIVTPIQP